MKIENKSFGSTVELYLVEGSPNGLSIASIHGWTGKILTSSQSSFGKLLSRPELDLPGVYIFYGADENGAFENRAYIGEGDDIRDRLIKSTKEKERETWWETVAVITSSDGFFTKGHICYLEAQLIEEAQRAGRVKLENSKAPSSQNKHLPESVVSTMKEFFSKIRMILPITGIDILKPNNRSSDSHSQQQIEFEIYHRKDGVRATASEIDGQFIVFKGSEARKDTESATNHYKRLKNELIERGILKSEGEKYIFSQDHIFKSPSAAAAIVLDRNSNGRTEWKQKNSNTTYENWKESEAKASEDAIL